MTTDFNNLLVQKAALCKEHKLNQFSLHKISTYGVGTRYKIQVINYIIYSKSM